MSGAGKGDAYRRVDIATWDERFDSIRWEKETGGLPRSACCGKGVRVGGYDRGEGGTRWYECGECGKPCDVGDA